MKCPALYTAVIKALSLPVRGAWIEIGFFCENCRLHQSLPVRGAWIEMSFWD